MSADPLAQLATSVAVHETRLGSLETEQARARERFHQLEGDRTTIRILTRQTTELADRVHELAGGVERIAQNAAERAVELALRKRDEHEDEEREKREALEAGRFVRRLQAASVGVAFGGFLSAVLFHFTG